MVSCFRHCLCTRRLVKQDPAEISLSLSLSMLVSFHARNAVTVPRNILHKILCNRWSTSTMPRFARAAKYLFGTRQYRFARCFLLCYINAVDARTALSVVYTLPNGRRVHNNTTQTRPYARPPIIVAHHISRHSTSTLWGVGALGWSSFCHIERFPAAHNYVSIRPRIEDRAQFRNPQ